MGVYCITCKNKEFICEYHNRTRLGKKMIASNHVSESDLLFLIPNNVKRMHGLPLSRVSKHGRSAKKYKHSKRRFILSFNLFDIIEEIVEEMLPSYTNEFFGEFVEVKNLVLEDKGD